MFICMCVCERERVFVCLFVCVCKCVRAALISFLWKSGTIMANSSFPFCTKFIRPIHLITLARHTPLQEKRMEKKNKERP